MCFSTMLSGNPHALGDLRLTQAFKAVQHKGLAPTWREFGEDFFQMLQTLLALRGRHRLVLLVGDRLGIAVVLGLDDVPDLLFTPVITQQVARHLEQKRPWLLDLGAVAIVEPLGKHILGHVRRIAGVFRAFAQVMQDVPVKPAK